MFITTCIEKQCTRPISALPKDTTKAILPDYNRPTLAYNWRTFSIACFFFSVSIDYKQYTNSIRDLIVLPFFILRLHLTISLIHVIALQHTGIQKSRACIVAWRKVLPTEKCLVNSF